MRRSIVAAMGILAMMSLAGCYESSEPLGPAEGGRVDATLLGTWRCEDPADRTKDVAHLVVVPFDRSQYYLEWHEDNKVERYRAFTTQLKERTLYNVTELKPAAAASKWVFLRAMRQGEGVVSLSVVDEDSLKGLKQPTALGEIARRARDESLYKVWAVCTTERRGGES